MILHNISGQPHSLSYTYRDHLPRWVYGQTLTKSSVSDSIGCKGIYRTVNLLLDPSGVETWLILSYILV